MDRSPAFLAALASAAVPGLDPVSVEALPSTPDQSFDVAFVQDAEHRRWVVRAPRSDVAGAEMDRTVGLLALLGRRLPFAVPAPKGFVALAEGGRAAVYPYLPGHQLDFAELPPGPGLAAELGRALAALHNTDPGVYEEAGLPSYDADAYRTRRLADLDRAAESGRVPTTLLARWEAALEDVSLWRFAPTATHGDLTGDQVLAVFTDDADASTGKIRALTGWEDAKVADPADDFAALVADAPPGAVETVLEAYAHQRVERPDANLLVRARLVAELGLLGTLMTALTRKDAGAVEVLATQLRRLDDEVHAAEDVGDDDYRRTSLAPVVMRTRPAPPPALVVDEDDEDLPGLPDDEPVEDLPAEPEVAEPAAAEPDPDDWEEEATHETRPITLTPEPAREPEPEAERGGLTRHPRPRGRGGVAGPRRRGGGETAGRPEPRRGRATARGTSLARRRATAGARVISAASSRVRRDGLTRRTWKKTRRAAGEGRASPPPRRARLGPASPPRGPRPRTVASTRSCRRRRARARHHQVRAPRTRRRSAAAAAMPSTTVSTLVLKRAPRASSQPARYGRKSMARPAGVGVGQVSSMIRPRPAGRRRRRRPEPSCALLSSTQAWNAVARRVAASTISCGRRRRLVEVDPLSIIGEGDQGRGPTGAGELDVDVGPRPAAGPLVEEHRHLGVPASPEAGSGRVPERPRLPQRPRRGPARAAAPAGRRGRASAT